MCGSPSGSTIVGVIGASSQDRRCEAKSPAHVRGGAGRKTGA
jgi:hypothetical protein